jgi:hypothetical protein
MTFIGVMIVLASWVLDSVRRAALRTARREAGSRY